MTGLRTTKLRVYIPLVSGCIHLFGLQKENNYVEILFKVSSTMILEVLECGFFSTQ